MLKPVQIFRKELLFWGHGFLAACDLVVTLTWVDAQAFRMLRDDVESAFPTDKWMDVGGFLRELGLATQSCWLSELPP